MARGKDPEYFLPAPDPTSVEENALPAGGILSAETVTMRYRARSFALDPSRLRSIDHEIEAEDNQALMQ